MKQRADLVLLARGMAESREKAQALILAGRVYMGEIRVNKASLQVGEEDALIIRGDDKAYASRGGYKLEKAMAAFDVKADDLVCMDVGAATGGFTDVLLRADARHVYAVDVGYGQLDWRLRQDKRVTVMERTNARLLIPEHFQNKPDLAVMDVSFISIRLILPAVFAILGEKGRLVSLVKPQFEAGRGQVGKNGVVREKGTHIRVLQEIRDFCLSQRWALVGLCFSPITGPKGNIEFLADIRPGEWKQVTDSDITALVAQAHETLD